MSVENLVGQTLGKYQLRQLLGSGGMGAVYRAYQADLKREVAVKVLPASFAREPGYIERFNREAEIAASLEHAHIVPVYDYGTQNDISYVVMRYLRGGSLAERLQHQQGGPSLHDIARILHQIAAALDYAHSKQVIHRDIKANNIMFDELGDAYIVDFGIAKLLNATSALTGSGIAMGTPPYMSPEQWRGENIGPSADQYAVGVLTYVMVTGGRLPFEADTPFAMMHKHLNETPTPPQTWRADLSVAVQATLNRAMAKDPADRYASVRDFARAFEDSLRGLEPQQTNFFITPLPRKVTETGQPDLEGPTSRDVPVSASPRRGLTPTMERERYESGAHVQRRSLLASPVTWLAALAVIVGGGALIALLVTQGGGGLFGAAASETPQLTETEITTEAAILLTLMPPTVTSTEAIAIVSSATATPTRDSTDVPTMTSSPTPAVPLVEALRSLPLRLGPGSQYPLVGRVEAGDQLEIVGISEDGAWYQVALSGGGVGWLSAAAASVETVGNVRAVPVIEAPTDTPTLTSTPTPSPSPTDTPTLTSTPTPSPSPTVTPTPTFTATPTASLTLTPTPATPVAEALRSLPLRLGPGSQYPLVGRVEAGARLEIAGISEDGAWYLVVLGDGSAGWLSASTASVETAGNVRAVPVIEAPTDTPTLTPTSTSTPTATNTPLPPTATLTPAPLPTSTPLPTPIDVGAAPFAQPLRDIALREGPGSEYALVARLRAGTRVEIVGISEDGTWYYVALPEGGQAWLSSSSALVETIGDLRSLPVIAPLSQTTVTPSPTPTPLEPTAAVDLRLAIGAIAEVNATAEGLTLRTGPSAMTAILEQLPDGALVTIIGGPIEEGGLIWWQIRAPSGREGWTFEADDGLQALIPLPAQPQIVICAGALPPRLMPQMIGRVRSEDPRPLNVRAGPGLSFRTLTQLRAGEQFLVLRGPVCADGYSWYEVRFGSGESGWLAEGDVDYFVEPVGGQAPIALTPLGPIATPRPGTPNSAALAAVCALQLEDDFRGNTSAYDWWLGASAGSTVRFDSEAYVVRIDALGGRESVSWGTLQGLTWGDVRVEAVMRASRFSLTPVRMGLWVRVQNASSFISIMLSSLGAYRIARYQDGFTDLVPWTPSTAVRTGDFAVNTVRVDLVGSRIDLYINGQFVNSVTDETWPSGRVTFWGSTSEIVPVEFYLDYIRFCGL